MQSTKKNVRVMGIDPGSRKTGYAIIEKQANKLVPITIGVISPRPTLAFESRLKEIYFELCELIQRFKPTAVSLESLYAHKSALSAIKLGQARGIALLAAAIADVPVFDYPPAAIKKSLTGYGNAPKIQMQEMAKRILGLKSLPPPDAADAVAIALCHIHYGR
ncbi:MAG: crossover junction endodeoxyribonuclease RuvC [Myxococcota bacterium]